MSGEDIYSRFGFRKFPKQVSFRSAKVQFTGTPTTLEIEAHIPDGTSIEATVVQEWSDAIEDPNYSQAITLQDGIQIEDLTEFEAGGEYVWVEFDLQSDTGEQFPGVLSYSLRR
ncbi:hypothetical protein EKH57_00190 (plasmid) [Halorubrum sp. BOL3-1]|uniref:hypothetical protein n=1 Tax=Halorubrum sp. BOL3-1 TaxID=2497325 RepID=UPI00100512A6|nr:hypothetical protein [Halorubrum sp. BOL3-1]QAU11347.1 hypothetical protein EKH57_00190 [Halorubrum sp. BOL3-1]